MAPDSGLPADPIALSSHEPRKRPPDAALEPSSSPREPRLIDLRAWAIAGTTRIGAWQLAAQAAAGQPPSRQARHLQYNARRKVARKTYRATIDIVILTADLAADDGP